MNREEELLKKRFCDLADKADRRNIVTFTEFLNLNELNIFYQTEKELSFVKCSSFGGYENAERQIIAFIPDALSYQEPSCHFPISCIRVQPLHEKYADALTHRDFLGALMNLGIERSVTGDILTDGASAHIFCVERMADFLCRELTQVKHTSVRCTLTPPENVHFTPKVEVITGSVASVRLDSLLSLAFRTSRSSLTGMIEGGKVFVNAKLVTSNGYKVKENDLISARGLGRFRYCGVSSETRKGRLIASIEKYIG